jgi:hypothetical protein
MDVMGHYDYKRKLKNVFTVLILNEKMFHIF